MVSGEAVVVSRLAGVASSRAVISAPPTFSAVARTCCSVCLAESAADQPMRLSGSPSRWLTQLSMDIGICPVAVMSCAR